MSQNQRIGPQLKQSLLKLVNYNRETFPNLVVSRLKTPIENQASKIQTDHALQKRKEFNNQQLLILVLNNHVKAILDLKNVGNHHIELHIDQHTTTTVTQDSARQFEELVRQFTSSNQEINRIIMVNGNFSGAIVTIDKMIKNYTSRTYDSKIASFAQSRLQLLTILYDVLIKTEKKPAVNGQIKMQNLPDGIELKRGGFSYKDLQQNDVHLIIQELDQKVEQLSTICEQIPQLQTFKRTLDLTMPEHNVNFTRIVDVLIELHHKVNKLISRRPEKLLKEIEQVEKQCELIEKTTDEFIKKLQSEEQMQIKVIYFDQKRNKSPDYFRRVQKNIVKISEHMIYCLNMESQYEEKMIDIRKLIDLFFKIITNLEENYEREWNQFRNRDELSEEELRIIQVLDQCIKTVEQNREELNRVREQYELKIQQMEKQAYNDIGYLEQNISQMNQQNQQLKRMIEQYQRERLSMRDQINDVKKKYSEAAEKHNKDLMKFQRIIQGLQQNDLKQKQVIQQLQKENDEQKVIIANLKANSTNSANNAQILDRIRELEEVERSKSRTIDELNIKYTNVDDEFRREKSEYAGQRARLEQTIVSLQSQIKRLESELQVVRVQQPSTLKQKQRQFEVKIADKDKTISELNLKLSQLNGKLSNMVNQFKNMEFELKKRQSVEQQLKNQIRNIETQNPNNAINDKLRAQLQASRLDLENAFKQIQNSKNGLTQLEHQIRRRQTIIDDLNRHISQLDAKFQHISNQNHQLQQSIQIKYQEGFNDGQKKQIQETNHNRETDLLNKIKELQNTIGHLQAQLSQKEKQRMEEVQRLRNQNQRYKLDVNKLNEQIRRLDAFERQNRQLKIEINRKDGELSRLNVQIKNISTSNHSKEQVHRLQGEINTLRLNLQKTQTERDQLIKIRSQLEAELNGLKILINDKEKQLNSKMIEIRTLQAEINTLKNSKSNEKQIEYLKEKIRSLEELIQIFTEEHAILQAKIKEYRLKENKNIEIINELNYENIELKKIIDSKDSEIRQYMNSRRQSSPINGIGYLDQSATKNQERINQIQKELNLMSSRLSESQIRIEDDRRIWQQKQANYISQIQSLKLSISKGHSSQNQGQYYLRVQGEKLEKLIKQMESGTSQMNQKVNQILSNSRRSQSFSVEGMESQSFKNLANENRLLIQQVRKLVQQKKQAALVLKQFPNPEFLTEFIYRIIIFFSELHVESAEAKAVWQQLTNIRNSYQGSQYFVVLEDFTKFYLQENMIQVYRRRLKEKADELQALKIQLDKFLEEKLKSESILYQNTSLSQSRVKLFRKRYQTEIRSK